MLVATNTTGQQQLGKISPTLSLNNKACIPIGTACIKTNNNNSSNTNASVASRKLVIMSSSLDVSTPTALATVSPTSNNNNSNTNNLQCNTSSNNNNGSQKYDTPYGGNVSSPCNSDGNNSQNLDDSNGNNNKNKSKNSNGVNLAAMDSTSRGERDSLSNISSNSLIRQSSASTNSCSVQFNESSPNNGDSSNSSSNASHINNDNNKSNDDEKLNNPTSKNSTIIKEEERDKSNSLSSTPNSTSGNGTTNVSLPNQSSISNLKTGLSVAIAKDEKDLVKNEETSLSSPNMSPVGFGSIVGTQINECSDNPGSTTKSNDSSSCDKRMALSGTTCKENEESSVIQSSGGLIVSGPNINIINSCNALNTNTNSLNAKSSLDGFCSDAATSNIPNTPCNIPLNASFIINNLSNTNGLQQGGGGGGGTNIISGGGSGINNCMEYMQQQNHIFVFSTQLANKGAEAVLAGQFPTIIAYHCTQPATKSFFEDFFLKNPMKMTKLQRQNTLNIMGGLPPGAGGGAGSGGQPPWVSHKLSLNKTETITSSASNSTGGGVLNENDMMCWDQTRSVIGSPAGDSTNALKILENAENSNNSSKSVCNTLSNDESGGIHSLQGVKVPDENLTPQQRQHREEQLAKLKKMNQFLFPESGSNDFHPQAPPGNNQIMAGKMLVPPEALGGGGMPGNPVPLINMQTTNMGNKLSAAAMRNISNNLVNHTKAGVVSDSQLDNIPNLGEDIIMPNDMMQGSGCGPNDMTVIPPSLKQGCMTNMNNPAGLGANSGRGLVNASGANPNMMNNSGSIGIPSGNLLNDPNNSIMGNNSDVLSPFNSNHCPSSNQEVGVGGGSSAIMGTHKNMNAPSTHPSDINSAVGIPQLEWSKLHHQIYEERLKTNHSNGNGLPPEISAGGPTICQQTLTRCNSTGIGGGGGGISLRTNSNANANTRGNQGPPPPYHPTQRSASVPIATQSPNPSSPNNPTSNISLPSPRASNSMGVPLSSSSSTTSPSMDVTSTSSSAHNTTNNTNSQTTTSSATAAVVGGNATGGNGGSTNNKNNFSQQGSPTTPGSSAVSSNRNRSSAVNNINSNPTTPLLHVSPKDIDSKNMNTTPKPDHKATRPNSQRSRSPLLNDGTNNNAMEPRFPSPGLNFAHSGPSGGSNQSLSNSFKNQNASLEHRQNLQQMPPQFCRRTDNMPLNPNSNRNNQNKMSNSFDPISSLAQMSQQLTGGGVSVNSGGVGNSPNNMSGLLGGPVGLNDINMNNLMGGPMMGGPVDPSMDHCNQNPGGGGGNMGMSGLGAGPGSVTGPFGAGNCNMMGGNPGPICQRLLNPKMCGPNLTSFNSNQVGGMGMRDAPSGFPGMMPTHRMINHRMSANFGNFNVSPNIQVKASTPNTIQYMPVRPQQNNNNNNMRVPPSLEFLQRYANPQMIGNSGAGGGLGTGPNASPSDMPAMNGPSDLNKIPNTSNNPNAMNQMNFFGNCNQMSAMGNMGQPVAGGGGGDQDELQGGGMMSNHDPMNIPAPHAPMLRGMRPMRHGGIQSGVGMNSASRMQHPGMGNIPPNGLGNNPFPGHDNDSLNCNDPTNGMFNNAAASGLYQHKNNKPSMGMAHGGSPNLNPNNGNNVTLTNNNLLNEQNPASNPMQNSVMMGPNNSMLNSNMPNSNNGGPSNMGGYKPFVGHTSNDLKYAQQYHSFQQQLYATSTRNQQPGGGGQQQPPNAMLPNSNPNAGFFVNK